jgi:hypothetical protein
MSRNEAQTRSQLINPAIQSKGWAWPLVLSVPLVISYNGHQWISFDRATQITPVAKPMADFPSPAELRAL